MVLKTIRGDRLHIAFLGKRNAGKSSLVNALANQQVAIVSKQAGTTTDPVYKSMELQPLGPVVFIDTAGVDDVFDNLGIKRVERTKQILDKTDLVLLIIDNSSKNLDYEKDLLQIIEKKQIAKIVVLNKVDLQQSKEVAEFLKEKPFVRVSTKIKTGINELKNRIIEIAPKEWEPPFLKDLVHPGEVVLLVTPIDLGAPKGRLIMPQVKALRDILDADAIPMMCKERELNTTLEKLKRPPALVVTDSQVFPQVDADVPKNILLTSFSILSIRQKGDLVDMVKGVQAVRNLKPKDRVLIAESCSHHPLEDDIGRVKIPRWLQHYVGGGLDIETVPGKDYPKICQNINLLSIVVLAH
jgi:[FeFe] hydrogenase H-cluster maturation GTPase HydF